MTGKRQDIVAAANRIFYRDGFAEVGIDKVVQEAEVALGTLYRHFKSRSELIVGALEERHARFLHELERRTAGRRGSDAVLVLIDTLGDWGAREGGNGCSTVAVYGLHWLCLRRRTVAHVGSLICLTPPVTMIWAWLMFA